MNQMKKITIAFALTFIFLASACGEDITYGDGLDPDAIIAATPTCRLGECKSPEPSPVSTEKVGIGTSPTPAKPTQQQAEEKFFDVSLVDYSPYYEPGQQLTMPVGFTLRVTNKDSTEGRPVRSFTSDDGSFDSGPLKPGQVWTRKFDQPGSYTIKDRAAGFIYASLEVR